MKNKKMSDIYQTVYKFYPKDISAFSKDYDLTPENILFEKTISQDLIGWEVFYNKCLNLYGSNYLEDRTNREPSHIITFHVPNQNSNYIIAFYVSKIIKKYCFRSSDIGPDIAWTNYPTQTSQLKEKWNFFDRNLISDINNICSLVSKYFNDYRLFGENLDEIVDDVSTHTYDLGHANLFNLFFSNYLY